jgi:hypothetical protein
MPFETVQLAGVGGPLLATALDAPSARTPTTAPTQLILLI